MTGSDFSTDEDRRLAQLAVYGTLRSAPDPCAQRIVRLATDRYAAPMAAATLIDAHRQVFKAEIGLGCDGSRREDAFCNHTILSREALCVPDAAADPRFADNPFVTGYPRLRAYMGWPLTTPAGYNLGALCVMDTRPRPDFTAENAAPLTDLANVLVEVMEVRMLSRTDVLTGAASRRHLVEELDREAARADRYARPLSLALLDIDHFKKINDAHGHPVGDTVLAALVERMKSCLREQDTIGRIGGEEFAILLPETPGERTAALVRRLRARISGRPFRTAAGPLTLTVSVGVANAAGRGCSASDLLQRADDELYRAKADGRDCVRIAFEDDQQVWRRAG